VAAAVAEVVAAVAGPAAVVVAVDT